MVQIEAFVGAGSTICIAWKAGGRTGAPFAIRSGVAPGVPTSFALRIAGLKLRTIWAARWPGFSLAMTGEALSG